MKDHYIEAVLQILGRDNDPSKLEGVIENLSRVLKARGHSSLLPSILRGVAKNLDRAPLSATVITLAQKSEAELKKHSDAIKETGIADDISLLTVEEDITLIGGFVLQSGDKQVDQSYKTQLLELYRKIAT